MKKIIATGSAALGYLVSGTQVLAQGTQINIVPPEGYIKGDLGNIISNALKVTFSIAALVVMVFLIIGAFQWIMSGGDKEAVGKARGKITSAIIGFVILAAAFVLVMVIGQILGTNFLDLKLPQLGT